MWYLQRDGTYREAKVRINAQSTTPHNSPVLEAADHLSSARIPFSIERAQLLAQRQQRHVAGKQCRGVPVLSQVVSVDVTVDPPSYAVELGESVRETESHRLQLRQAGEAPPSVPAQRPLAIPAGAPQQAALELEDDDFGDFADAAEAAQPNVSQLKAFTPSANGFSASGGGLSQLQPHSNGFSHATVAMNGLNGHAPPMHSGTAAYVPAAASQENGEDGFAAFVDADDLPPGPSVAGTQGAGQACSAQFALTGQPWPDPTKCTAAPAAVQLADQPAIHNLHASHQHARGPSAESSASLRSADDPASSVFSGGFPLGALAASQPCSFPWHAVGWESFSITAIEIG